MQADVPQNPIGVSSTRAELLTEIARLTLKCDELGRADNRRLITRMEQGKLKVVIVE